MFDQKVSDKFFNSLATSVAQHLENIHRDASVAATVSAIAFADSNDPQHRVLYLSLRARSDTIRKIAQAFIEDAAISAENRDRLVKIFNGLEPTPKTSDTSAQASTVATPPQVTFETAVAAKT